MFNSSHTLQCLFRKDSTVVHYNSRADEMWWKSTHSWNSRFMCACGGHVLNGNIFCCMCLGKKKGAKQLL
jgi:hypothetical protein